MNFGITLQSIIPLRLEPSHRSEMVSQVLFGELFTIILADREWVRVRLSYDGYEGWLQRKQITFLHENEFLRLLNADTPCSTDLVQLVSNETRNTVTPVLLGSSFPGIKDGRFTINGEEYFFEGSLSETSELGIPMTSAETLKVKQAFVRDIMVYLDAPYQWGGRSPFGIDCSGFVQMAFKLRKIKILRDASQQAGLGEPLSFISESEPGDLAFFDNEEGLITHVGILIDKGRIMHASGKVRIDPIDHEGIYNEEERKYTHKLRIIKRII